MADPTGGVVGVVLLPSTQRVDRIARHVRNGVELAAWIFEARRVCGS